MAAEVGEGTGVGERVVVVLVPAPVAGVEQPVAVRPPAVRRDGVVRIVVVRPADGIALDDADRVTEAAVLDVD